jgi:hypothetical protein
MLQTKPNVLKAAIKHFRVQLNSKEKQTHTITINYLLNHSYCAEYYITKRQIDLILTQLNEDKHFI